MTYTHSTKRKNNTINDVSFNEDLLYSLMNILALDCLKIAPTAASYYTAAPSQGLLDQALDCFVDIFYREKVPIQGLLHRKDS